MATLQRLALRGTPKATKAAARYTPAGGAERCGMCRHYVPSSSCARIQGPVSAAGWCALFSRHTLDPHHAGVQSFGGAPPSLDLGFLVPGTMPPGITFTRASTGTYFDATGTLQTATANTPRWDYDPVTHQLLGLLIEESRINLALNSATLGTQSVAVTAQAYALSFYGTGTITKSGTATGALVGTGATQRVSQVFTPTAGSLTLTVTGSVTNAQLEAGSYPTSYIATAASAVTRQADSATMPVGAWYNAAQGAAVGEYMTANAPNPSNRPNGVCCISDNTASNRLVLRGQSGNNAFPVVITSIGGTTVSTALLPAIVANVPNKLGGSWSGSGNTVVGVLNGSTGAFNNTGLPAGGALTTLMFGNDMPSSVNTYLNGWLRSVRYWPRALSAAELQSVTT